MGWDGTGNREKPVNWAAIRAAVCRRAGSRCEKCGTTTKGTTGLNRGAKKGLSRGWCDHVIPWYKGGSNDISNMQWLCTTCHSIKSAQEAKDRALDIEAAPKHPGMK